MRIKTFYAKSMAEAIQEIKAALGPDALLLSTKEIPSRSGVGGPVSGFEVVAASDSPYSADSDDDLSAPAGLTVSGPDRFRLQAFPGANETDVARTYAPPFMHGPETGTSRPLTSRHRPSGKRTRPVVGGVPESPFSDELRSGLFQDLTSCGVDEWLAHKLLTDAGELVARTQQPSRNAILRAAGHAAQAMLAAPARPDGIPVKRVVAFVGPTGVGKTTTLAKLAARLALQEKKKIVLMTLDSHRIGAVEQLRTYAGLMGIPFRFVREMSGLPEALREHEQRDCVLIDTAGRASGDLNAIHDLAGCLQSLGRVERHLVLSAATKPADIRDTVDRFEVCKPDHLLFTKLDETSTLGSILNEVIRTGKHTLYYADGQRVPEDLHPMPAEQIVNLVLHQS